MPEHIPHTQKLSVVVEALQVQLSVTPSTEGIVSNMLVSAFQRTSNFFKDIFTTKIADVPVVDIRAEYKPNNDYKHLVAADYVPLSRLPLDGMEGFTGKYTDYTPVVRHGLDYYKRSLDEALNFYKTLVGSIVSNKSSRNEWTDLTHRFKESEKTRLSEDKDNARFWREGSHEAVTTVGAVISRLADLRQLDEDAAALASALAACDLKAVQQRVNDINDITNLLVMGMDDGSITDLSKPQVLNLAAGITELAMQVEHYAVAVYRGHVYLNALKRLQDAVVKFK